MRRALPAALALLALLALAGTASAAIRTATDDQGRTMRFSVEVPGTSIEPYADVLRKSIHGDEISRVTVRIVSFQAMRRICGSDAGACYGGRRHPRIVIPAERDNLARVLLHEYGHHIDATHANGRLPEPNGTPRWYAARHIGQRLHSGFLALDYSHGWSRSVPEIFAEDYVQLQLKVPYRIRGLKPPSAAVLRALRLDLTGSAAGPPPVEPPSVPLVIHRSGTLAPDQSVEVPFGLLGPGRRVQVRTTVTGAGGPAAARVEIRCDGTTIGQGQASDGVPVDLDLRNQGPGDCRTVVTGVSGSAGYDLELTLSIETAPTSPFAAALASLTRGNAGA